MAAAVAASNKRRLFIASELRLYKTSERRAPAAGGNSGKEAGLLLAPLRMGVSRPDAHPAGHLPSACQAARCHCPLLFQGDLTNKTVRTPDFSPPPASTSRIKTKWGVWVNKRRTVGSALTFEPKEASAAESSTQQTGSRVAPFEKVISTTD